MEVDRDKVQTLYDDLCDMMAERDTNAQEDLHAAELFYATLLFDMERHFKQALLFESLQRVHTAVCVEFPAQERATDT